MIVSPLTKQTTGKTTIPSGSLVDGSLFSSPGIIKPLTGPNAVKLPSVPQRPAQPVPAVEVKKPGIFETIGGVAKKVTEGISAKKQTPKKLDNGYQIDLVNPTTPISGNLGVGSNAPSFDKMVSAVPMQEKVMKETAKFGAKTTLGFAEIGTSALDYGMDLLSRQLLSTDKPEYKVITDTKTKWKDWYDKQRSVGNMPTQKADAFVKTLQQSKFLDDPEEYKKYTLEEKIDPKKGLGRTVLNLGSGVLPSVAWFVLNPVLGFVVSAGSVGNDVKQIAKENGASDKSADNVSLLTAITVGALDKIVPDEVLNKDVKKEFLGGLVKRFVLKSLAIAKTTGKEAATEIAQEDIQLLAENVFRKDLGWDEVKTRNVMAGLGGLFGGAGFSIIGNFDNTIKSELLGVGVDNNGIGPGEYTSEEIRNKVINSPLETTKEGKELLKMSFEAEQAGQNIKITSPEELAKLKDFNRVASQKNTDKLKESTLSGEREAERIDNEANIKKFKLYNQQFNKDGITADTEVDIYRWGTGEIKPGDQVTVSKARAESYGDQRIGGELLSGKSKIGGLVFNDGAKSTGEFVYAPKNQFKVPSKKEVTSPKPSEITKTGNVAIVKEKISIKDVNLVKDIKSAKFSLKRIKEEVEQTTQEVLGKVEVAKDQRYGLDTKNIATLKRVYTRSQKFQEGDIETIRDSKWGSLVDGVIEDVQIKYPDMNEQEAFDFAMQLPTKSEEKVIKTSDLKKLEKRQKIISNYLKILEEKNKQITGEEKIKIGNAMYDEWKAAIDKQENLTKIISKERQKTLDMLRDKGPVGTGKVRESTAYKRLVERYGEEQANLNTTYNVMSQKDQMDKALKLIESNQSKALDIALGLTEAPSGLDERAVTLAMADKALRDGDIEAWNRIEASGSLRQTRKGQSISLDRGRFNENSPHRFIQEIMDRRLTKIGGGVIEAALDKYSQVVSGVKDVQKRVGGAKGRAMAKIDIEVAKLREKVKMKDSVKKDLAQKLINSLICKT